MAERIADGDEASDLRQFLASDFFSASLRV